VDTLANGLYTSERAIGISLRGNERHIAHSVRALLVSAHVPEREEDRGCDRSAASGWVPPRGVYLFACRRGLAGVKFKRAQVLIKIKTPCARIQPRQPRGPPISVGLRHAAPIRYALQQLGDAWRARRRSAPRGGRVDVVWVCSASDEVHRPGAAAPSPTYTA
jgi:hypothetical protein